MKKTMDALEILVYLRDNQLPEQTEERIEMIRTLTTEPLFFIYYDDICAYSRTFRETYSEDYIRTLLRRGMITGKGVYREIQKANLTDEEKAILYLFFKGRVSNHE